MGVTVSISRALAYGVGEPVPAMDGAPDVRVAVANMLDGRIGEVAGLTGIPLNTLQKKVSLTNDTHHLTVWELQRIQRAMGEISPTQFLAAAEGYVCVAVNPVEVASLSEGLARVLQAMGDFAAASHEANEGGRGVSSNGLRRVRHCEAELLGAVNAVGAFVASQAVQPPGGA